jgi:hypothetical protein
MSKYVKLLLCCALIATTVAPAANAAVKTGSICPKLGAKATFAGKQFRCIKSGKKFVWSVGLSISTPNKTKTPNPTPPATPVITKVNLAEPTLPTVFDFTGGRDLSINISLESNIEIDIPRSRLEFKIPNGQWSTPSQTRTIQGEATQLSKNSGQIQYKIEFNLEEYDPIGRYNFIVEPLTSSNKVVEVLNNSRKVYPLDLSRAYWGKGEVRTLTPSPAYEYSSFKNEKFTRTPWVGRNVVLLTYSPNLDPGVMSRILHALDAGYDTYKEVTQYTPGIARAYNGKITIAEMTPETVGCGAACGYLGATGIEIQSPLFMRLYNGVRDHDQFDEPLFYELGRNFWNYGKYQEVLVGNSGSAKWFDINTTGFAVFMRYFVTEVNGIPIGPNDGPNKPGLEFKADMLNLMKTQRASKDNNFGSTFFSTKFDSYGFGVYGFWSSLIYYFMPAQNRTEYVNKFLLSLGTQPSPRSVAESVNNVVKALSFAVRRDVSQEFYAELNFNDAKNL